MVRLNKKQLLKPQSKPGKFAVYALAAFVLFLLLWQSRFIPYIPTENRGFFANPLLAGVRIATGVSGVLAFFSGITALIRNKEKAIIVFIATLIGLFVLLFWLGEVISPH